MPLSREEKLHEALVVPRHARLRLPDTELVERPDWVQITTPSVTSGGMNEVVLAVLDEADADRVVDETIARYRRLGLRFKWCVGPDSRPADLPERLARRGLVAGWARAMVRETAPLPAVPDVVVEAVTPDTLSAFCRVMAEGWEMPVDELERVHRHALASSDPQTFLFLARVRGEPAGIAAYVPHPRSAYLLSGVVLPRFRNKGVYRALLDARLRDAARRGIALATTQAREETSAPILDRLGFETVCRFPVFFG